MTTLAAFALALAIGVGWFLTGAVLAHLVGRFLARREARRPGLDAPGLDPPRPRP